MAKLIIENLTPTQAKALGEWFEGQGEQDCEIWFDENCEDPAPRSDVRKEGGCLQVDDEGNTTLFCRTP